MKQKETHYYMHLMKTHETYNYFVRIICSLSNTIGTHYYHVYHDHVKFAIELCRIHGN